MKKLAILTLAGMILFTAGMPFALASDVNNQSVCNSNHVKCREYVFTIDGPWYKMALMLTACDIAFGKCMLSI
jgi:hypothetical protein